jgi:hypothetical protein
MCMRRIILELPARTLQILAEAYELSPDEVGLDVVVLRGVISALKSTRNARS